MSWQLDRVVSNDIWSGSAGLLILGAGAFALISEHWNRPWPFATHFDAYFLAGLMLAASFVALVVGACISGPGSPAPIPYIPVLNPLDVLSIAAVALMGYGIRLKQARTLWRLDESSRLPEFALGGTALFLSTLSVVRIVHHVTGVPWYPSALFDSVAVQSSLSIYWAILGLSGMVWGASRARRSVWMIGAGLMGVVVLKLFVIDLGNTGTVARIISFLGVGVMLLVVGYFSPVPPKQEKTGAQRGA